MLIIRKNQMQVLSEHLVNDFEQRLFAHVRKVFPEDCALLGEEGVRERIHQGVKSSTIHGIAAEYDVARFIDLTFILSPTFYSEPGIPWATAILNDSSLQPWQKVDRLWRQTKRELEAASEMAKRRGRRV